LARGYHTSRTLANSPVTGQDLGRPHGGEEFSRFQRVPRGARLSEPQRFVPGELQQFFDYQEIVLEELPQRGIICCLDKLMCMLGGEIEQKNGVVQFSFGFRLQALETKNQTADIGDGLFRRTPRCASAIAGCPLREVYDVEHLVASSIAEKLRPEMSDRWQG
jgi:hypothetical protein